MKLAVLCALLAPLAAVAAERKIVVQGSAFRETKIGHLISNRLTAREVTLAPRRVGPADGAWAMRFHPTDHVGYIVNCSISPVGQPARGIWEVELRDRSGSLLMSKSGRWGTDR